MSEYLIWSNEHRAWWRPKSCGYTKFVSAAGRYPRDEALLICKNSREGWRTGEVPPEVPVRVEDLPEGALPLPHHQLTEGE